MEKTEQNAKAVFHKTLCDRLHDLYLAKNSDYGDSFHKVREEIPNAILVRLSDKLNRLKSLMPKDDVPKTRESIDDTLIDIANYALLELTERAFELMDPEIETDEDDEMIATVYIDPNPPLTWDDVQDLVGKPVWCSGRNRWAIIESLHSLKSEKFVEFEDGGKFYFEFKPGTCAKSWKLYRREKCEENHEQYDS